MRSTIRPGSSSRGRPLHGEALAARGGLWGNHGYEAAYAMGYDDGDGEPLDGSKRGPRVWSAFRPILRIYEPEDAVFDGGYELPPITAA